MNGSRYFSTQAREYACFRPGYPALLFDFLADYCAQRVLAWDCGTGTGQFATSLAHYFQSVIATDASAEQISHAETRPNIVYKQASCEESGLADSSVDLVSVAQALHWFDVDLFFSEARRVMKPDGLLAVVSYGLPRVRGDIDSIIDQFHSRTLAPYWPNERSHVDNGYTNLAFPLKQLDVPNFHMQESWDLVQFTGYLSSWSAVTRYKEQLDSDPLPALFDNLETTWAADEKLRVTWPLLLRLGQFQD